MTETQKFKIFNMRMQGIGYHVIGNTLNLDENHVQQYCKTHGLAGDAALVSLNHAVWCEKNNRCVFCGKKLEQPRTGRRKRFCSGTVAPYTVWCGKEMKSVQIFDGVYLMHFCRLQAFAKMTAIFVSAEVHKQHKPPKGYYSILSNRSRQDNRK